MESFNIHNTKPFSLEGRIAHCRVVDVYDGDTLTAIIQIYPGYFSQIKIRLNGIDTPEMRGGTIESKARAIDARNRLLQFITARSDIDFRKKSTVDIRTFLNSKIPCMVFIKCYHHDKYGRVLGDIYASSDTTLPSFNELLVKDGYAVEYDGGTKPRETQIPSNTWYKCTNLFTCGKKHNLTESI